MKRMWLISLALLGMTIPALAGELILSWDFSADSTPKPESFLVTYRSSNAPDRPQQFRIPNLGRVSCDGVKDAPDLTPDSICGRPPDCLPPGLYAFEVQAEEAGQLSEASNLATCEALPGCRYTCEGVTLPPALQHLMQQQREPNGPSLPNAEEVRQVVDTLAHTPTPAPPPSMTTPAPTIAQVADQVQAALNQLLKTPV